MAHSLFPCRPPRPKKRVFLLPRKLIVFLSLLFQPCESERGVERREGCVIIPSFLLSVGGRNGWQQRKRKERKKKMEDSIWNYYTANVSSFFFAACLSLYFCESGKKPVVEGEGPENRISLDVKSRGRVVGIQSWWFRSFNSLEK